MVDILWSRGIRYVVAMQALGFGDDFINIFQPLWTAKGGKYIRIQYDPGAGDFSRLLMEAEVDTEAALVKYPGKVAELLLGFDEVADIAVQAQGYPHLYNDVKWFFGGSASNQELIEKAGLQLTELGFYNLLPAEPVTVNYWDLKQRFEATTSTPFDIYNAYAYDAAFALVGAVVTAESTDAGVVSAALPGFCKTYTGVSGNCALNTYGDRVPGPYDIWSYGDVEGDETVESVKVGYGVPRTHQVTWDINVGGVLALDSVSASGSSSTCTAYIRNIGKIDRIVTTAYVNGLQADVEATLIPRNEVVPIVITDNFVEGVNYEVKVACSDIPFLIFSVIAGP
jgi:hypothetical protein